MESFDLHRRFDIVTCLFSSIGYARSVRDLRRTVRNLARHTTPGGVVVVEPWLTPRVFQDGLVHHLIAGSRDMTVVRMNGTHRRRGRSLFDFHYLVGRRGEVRHYVETHDLGLFDARTMRAAFRDAGLTVTYLVDGLSTRRGLYVGLRPRRSPRGRRVGVSPRRAGPRAGR
jgi:dTDP-3-amino-3,6-dideoxy-alpha-D-glucopyranose N,N-dimethyltransferase